MNKRQNESFLKSLLPSFLVLLILIGSMVGIVYLCRNALSSLLLIYPKNFVNFVIYAGCVGLSLISAIVMFGILRSTGVFKKVGKHGKYEFGGAMAGFLVTLMFLVASINYIDTKPHEYKISGNVSFKSDKSPVKDAIITIKGIQGPETRTDHAGNFTLIIPANQDREEYELMIKNKQKYDTYKVSSLEKENFTIEIEKHDKTIK